MKLGRRVVTGLNAAGESTVIRSDAIESNRNIWLTDKMPTALARPETIDAAPDVFLPQPHGTKFSIIELLPIPIGADPGVLEPIFAEAFANMGASDFRGDTKRHPGMHRSPTLDYVIVLSGAVTLLLADTEVALQPFDVVIQRATDHAWINRGPGNAYLAAVMIDAVVE